jgi:hypothetical protein
MVAVWEILLKFFVTWKSYYVFVLVQLNSFSYYFVLDGEERNEQGKG